MRLSHIVLFIFLLVIAMSTIFTGNFANASTYDIEQNESFSFKDLHYAGDKFFETIYLGSSIEQENLHFKVQSNRSWASIKPNDFNLQPGEEIELKLIVDAKELKPGKYEYEYTFKCLGCTQKYVIYMRCYFTLYEKPPGFGSSSQSIDFGNVVKNDTSKRSLVFENTGNGELECKIIDLPSWILTDQRSFSIGSNSKLRVYFTALTKNLITGNNIGRAKISTNAGDYSLSFKILVEPSLTTEEEILDFGDIYNNDKSLYFEIENISSQPVDCEIKDLPSWISIEKLNFKIPESHISEIPIVANYEKLNIGENIGHLVLSYQNETIEVILKANRNLVEPSLKVFPIQFDIKDVYIEKIYSESFTITNDGTIKSVLNFEVSCEMDCVHFQFKSQEVPYHNSMDIKITLDTKSLEYSEYETSIILKSNDPNNETFKIPFKFKVIRQNPKIQANTKIVKLFYTNDENHEHNIYFKNIADNDSILDILATENKDWMFLYNGKIKLNSKESKPLTIGIKTLGLTPGFYKGEIYIASNDADNKNLSICLEITVTEKQYTPSIYLEDESLNLSVYQQANFKQPFYIKNTGEDNSVLVVSVKFYDNWIKFSETSFKISKNEKKVVYIYFDLKKIPTNKPISSNFTLITNDPKKTNVNVPISLLIKPLELIIQLQIGSSIASVQKPGEKNKKNITLDVAPTIINGRTVVPLRFLAEAFGAKLSWDGEAEEIKIKYKDMSIHLWLHRNQGRKYDAFIERAGKKPEKIILEASPCILNGRTMVPIRFIAETFGAEIEWEAKTQTITLRKAKSL